MVAKLLLVASGRLGWEGNWAHGALGANSWASARLSGHVSEARRSGSEARWSDVSKRRSSRSERWRCGSEVRWSVSEVRRSVSEARRSASEARSSSSERRWSVSEVRWSDLVASGRGRRRFMPGWANSAQDFDAIKLLLLSFPLEGKNLGLAERVDLGLEDLDFVEGGRGLRSGSGSWGLRRDINSERILI